MNEPNVRGSMTEEEREMLELAAKAAGYEVSECTCKKEIRVSVSPRRYAHWNPLEDDGDALRLAVKLHIFAIPIRGRTAVVAESYPSIAPRQPEERYGDDPCAATRRVIVRAAAEIGRAM